MSASTPDGGSRGSRKEYVRPDGVRMGYDPYQPDMIAKYGAPGETDDEGFNPYADTVGPGIYGGRVKRNPETGEVVMGRQYQDHNPRPGPVYAGGGYSAIVRAMHESEEATKALLDRFPDLVNDVTTGGATPLHMCGMSRRSDRLTQLFIDRGADIEAVDTYGYRPLHRMASNNLASGAEALLRAGADPQAKTCLGGRGETPWQVARAAGAADVLGVLVKYMPDGQR